jgi:putative endonuclease
MQPKDVLGREGEQLAADFLTAAGLQILARNWRCEAGEIDIVALDAATLVIVEVKTRSGVGFGTPVEAVTAGKARRLRKLAVCWARASGRFFEEIRIDVVGVLRARCGEVSIEHVRGVA